MEDEPLQTWQQRAGRGVRSFLRGLGKALETIPDIPWPCGRCRQQFLIRDYFSYTKSLPSRIPDGFFVPQLCCQPCFEELKAAIEQQLRLEQINRWVAGEDRRVWTNLERARKKGNKATLTLEQWLYIGKQFDWKCGYCGAHYEAMEHFTPIALGGGTTADNVFPVCKDCNTWKRARHPNDIKPTVRSPEAVRAAAAKLAQLQHTMPGCVAPGPAVSVTGESSE